MIGLDNLYSELRAYKRSRILAAAVHLGVFESLGGNSGPITVQVLADRLGLAGDWLESILNVLGHLGLVAMQDGECQITPAGRSACEDPAFQAFAGYHYHTFDAWADLPSAMRSGQAVDFHRQRIADRDFCRSYLQAMDSIAKANLSFLQNHGGSALHGRVLDVGAGPATLCRHLALNNPKLDVTALDFPEMVNTAQDLFGTPTNFNWVGDDMRSWDPQQHFDSVYVSHVLEYCPKHEMGQWLAMVGELLVPGGNLIMVSFLGKGGNSLDEELEIFRLSTGLNGTRLGYIPSWTELAEVLRQNGFLDISIVPSPMGPSYAEYLITSRRP